MTQITSAIIGITLALVAVFLPMAFFPGTTGGIYRQFSMTLTLSIAFSALLALTLTPALCATLLKPHALHLDAKTAGKFDPRPFCRVQHWMFAPPMATNRARQIWSSLRFVLSSLCWWNSASCSAMVR